jgi:hypothetical protein
MENGWQGKPPQRTSKGGISSASIFVMFPAGTSWKLEK